MNVAGYVRVSTEMQKKEGSHEKQRDKLRTWGRERDHDIDIYQDIAISGQDDDRQAYNDMMQQLSQYDAVVVRELSRFGRSLRKVLEDIEKLDEENVDFISLQDDFDTSSAQGKLIFQVIGAFNEFWANLARERTKEMIEQRRKEGKPVGRPKKLSEEKRKKLCKQWEKGISYNALTKLHDIDSASTAKKYVEEGLEKNWIDEEKRKN